MYKAFACLLTGFLFLASCENAGNCGNDFSTAFNIGFVSIIYPGTDSAETVNTFIAFNSIYATSKPDSLFVEKDTLFNLALTIDPFYNETTYIFDSSEGIDSISISYVLRPRLISERCDPVLSISSLAVTTQSYDSVVVINTNLRKSNEQTLQIYH